MSLRDYVFNYLSLFILLGLTANSLTANWSWNLLDDLLYTRIQTTFFHNTHAVSMLSVCVAAFILLAKAKRLVPIIIVCCIATASIHELTLAVFDMGLLGGKPPPNLSVSFVVYLGAFLVLAAWKGQDFQRRILGAQFFVLLAIYAFDLVAKPGSSIAGSGPTPLFYNPLTNAVEVFSWLIPSAMWLLPQKWVEGWKILSPR